MRSPIRADWDRWTPPQRAARQEALLRSQLVDVIGPSSPWWRERLATLGRTAAEVAGLDGLRGLPPVGERDICPDGDPAGAAVLVVQAGETGFALHAPGPVVRRALAARLVRPGSYRAVVEAETRATSFVWAGTGLRFPVASTRADLDVVARAGARMWRVLGLSGADVVVSAQPAEATAVAQALELAALGAGAPLLRAGADAEAVAEALRLVPATVLAVPSTAAAALLAELAEAGVSAPSLGTLLLLGAPYDDERAAARAGLPAIGAPDSCLVLAAHVPDGHRLMWAECRPSAGRTGLHTYPDLEVAQLVDPETGEPATGGGELVLTQLGMRGTALVRWRTGDLVDDVQDSPCSGCGRTVPRAVGLRSGALVPLLQLRTGTRPVDLRAVSAALAGRADVADWRVSIGPGGRDDSDQVLVHVTAAASADPAEVAVGVARDVRATAGLLPTQVVLSPAGALPYDGVPLTRRVLSR